MSQKTTMMSMNCGSSSESDGQLMLRGHCTISLDSVTCGARGLVTPGMGWSQHERR
jgi:hypothetical protein